MSLFAFEVPSEERAMAVLRMVDVRQAEFYHDRVAATRRLEPVTTARERLRAQQFKPEGESFACVSCSQFAFPRPRFCFWCAADLTR